MKLEKLFFATVLSGLAFTACVDNDDKSEWNDGSQPISFTSSIKGINTRAVDSKWTAGDKIGVFMKATSGDLASAIAVNKQHATDANGNVSAADADNALYYPTDGSSVDFIAYYPYTASLTMYIKLMSQTKASRRISTCSILTMQQDLQKELQTNRSCNLRIS